jgi:SET domain-containing protein
MQNHSCDPNCNIVAVYINEAYIEKPLLTIFTIRDVAKGEELCFSYFGEPDEEDFRPMVRPIVKSCCKTVNTNVYSDCKAEATDKKDGWDM